MVSSSLTSRLGTLISRQKVKLPACCPFFDKTSVRRNERSMLISNPGTKNYVFVFCISTVLSFCARNLLHNIFTAPLMISGLVSINS